jgi:NADH-quinone oxidoreductase subunit C
MNETNSSPVPAPAATPTPPPAKPAAAPAPAVAPVAPPPPPPVPAELAHVALPFQGTDFTLKGYHADATVTPDQVVSAASRMDQEGFALDSITGVDWMAQNQMELVYDFFHPHKSLRAVVRTRVPRETPELPTISAVFPGANWHERETHDFFGIKFSGHPDLSPFLLPEDADYHPLRKDFAL